MSKETKKENTEAYLVTARKWRPMVFEDVIGQSHVSTTLKNAIASGRLHHAYIFSGPRGCGKTTTARILAKAINCEHPVDTNPDNKCELCTEITEGRSLNVFEIDGASNRGIDEIRNLRESVRYGPSKGKYKVYIIDEVHMLTKEAFNALLKTLEEPPAHVLFIFATTEVHKVPLTILSRCQRFDFHRNTIEDITSRLKYIAGKEKMSITDGALLLIAKKADGSMRDGQSIFDQIVSFCGTDIDEKQIIEVLNLVDEEFFFRASEIIRKKDAAACLAFVGEIMAKGYDLREFLSGFSEHFRNLLVVAITGSAKLVETSEPFRKKYEEEAKAFSESKLLRFIKIVNDTDAALRFAQQPRYRLEIAMLLMIKIDDAAELGALLDQIEQLKKKLNSAASAPSTASTPAPAKSRGFDEGQYTGEIRGMVKSTQPNLRPDQVVSSFKTAFGAKYKPENHISLASEAPTPAVSGVALSIDEVSAKWQEFIAEVRNQKKINVATVLAESKLVEVNGVVVKLSCASSFQSDAVKMNRDFLLQVSQSVFGAKLRFDCLIGESGNGGTDHSSASASPDAPAAARQSSSPYPESLSGDLMQDPVVQALMKELGAKPIGQ
jgi:DNA polymerase-3 subunit gamma/tau